MNQRLQFNTWISKVNWFVSNMNILSNKYVSQFSNVDVKTVLHHSQLINKGKLIVLLRVYSLYVE